MATGLLIVTVKLTVCCWLKVLPVTVPELELVFCCPHQKMQISFNASGLVVQDANNTNLVLEFKRNFTVCLHCSLWLTMSTWTLLNIFVLLSYCGPRIWRWVLFMWLMCVMRCGTWQAMATVVMCLMWQTRVTPVSARRFPVNCMWSISPKVNYTIAS